MKLHTYLGTVYPWQCDHMGHMNVMWYTGKFDEATWQFFGQLGLSPAWLRSQQRGMAAVEQLTEYKCELHAGDLVAIHTELLEVRVKALRFRHVMYRHGDDEPVSISTLTGVHLDTTQRRASAFPEEMKERWQQQLQAAPAQRQTTA